MVFSSISFLIFFLPAVLVVYFIIPRPLRGIRNFFLLLASLAFYGFGGVRFLGLMLVTIVLDYICGLLVSPKLIGTSPGRLIVRRIFLTTDVVVSLGLLAYFKYAGFFSEIVNSLGVEFPIIQVVLPIGISFFTFQGLSYVIDVYRGDAECQKNPFYVALYIALFPQLVAGPIVRYTTVDYEISHRRENIADFSAGLTRFCFGLGKKMIVANSMAAVADGIYGLEAANLAPEAAWVGAIAYTFQIYFDFSAYSDMAIGLGRMFGFHFLENFNYPYISKSVTDFWRRWHISLSSWFRDYVYIPLGGSYCSKSRNIFNLFVVWLLTGIWHGAAWNYIVWGLWFYIFLVGEKFVWSRGLEKIPSIFQHTYAFLIAVISWVFFRSPDLGYAVDFLQAMFGLGETVSTGAAIGEGAAVYYLLEYWPEWIIAVLACLPWKVWIQNKLEAAHNGFADAVLIWVPKIIALGLLVITYTKLVTGSFNPFIYFQF